MEDKTPLLSICIPTNGVVEWVVPVIESIYSQGADDSMFEVVITDNGKSSALSKAVEVFKYNNFRYYKTSSPGFTNQIDAFEKCRGEFCKMLNHRSRMLPGSIDSLLSIIWKYRERKPVIYCAEGHAKGGEFIECKNLDEFVCSLGYYLSWSAGTGVWKEDLSVLREKTTDKMFPHILFLAGLRKESEYVIWNGLYEQMANDAGKGGYNVFQTFAVHFLDILIGFKTNGRISQKTFVGVKNELYGFLVNLYMREVILPTKHTFIIEDVRGSMSVYYGSYYYRKMVLKACIGAIPFGLRKMVRNLFIKK